jgi:hypothetical protein
MKNVVISWYGELTLEIRKENPIKCIRIKTHLDISIMDPLGINFLINIKKFISKGLLKIRFNFDPSKVHNYHLVKVSQNKFTFNFIISFFNLFLVPINNLNEIQYEFLNFLTI